MKIDFTTSNWKSKLESIEGKKKSSVTFENYNGEIDNDIYNLNIKGIIFRNGTIKTLPKSITSDICKALSKLHFFGESINELPTNIEEVNTLKQLDIRNTSIETIKIDFTKTPLLETLNLNSNTELNKIEGDLGACQKLVNLEIFECNNLKKIEVTENQNLKNIRLGSWKPEFNILQGLKYYGGLETVIIDNYKTCESSISFLQGKNIKKLQILCVSKENISIIKELQSITDLTLERQIKCRSNSFLFQDLATLPYLTNLTLNLGKLSSPQKFIDYVSLFKSLQYVMLTDTEWNNKKQEYAKSNIPKTIKLDINN